MENKTNTSTSGSDEQTEAFKEYIKMSDAFLIRLEDGVMETEEEAKLIEEKQNALWDQMTPEEQMYADELVLSCVIRIQAEKERARNEKISN
jgi:hypothetical protein